MTYLIELPDGTWAQAETMDASMLAVETLIEDAARWLRQNVVIKRDGEIDTTATAMAQSAGMLV